MNDEEDGRDYLEMVKRIEHTQSKGGQALALPFSFQ